MFTRLKVLWLMFRVKRAMAKLDRDGLLPDLNEAIKRGVKMPERSNAESRAEAHPIPKNKKDASVQMDLGELDLSLANARAEVTAIKAGWAPPKACPCCGQRCQRYKRKLNSDMGRWLIWLVMEYGREKNWIDVKGVEVRGGDYAKLEYWGLVEHKPNEDEKKKSSGLWKPTKDGVAFVFNRLRVPSHVFLFDGELLGFETTQTNIEQAIGDAFDYPELMQDSVPADYDDLF